MNDWLILIRPGGTIITVNHAFEQLTEFKANELIGRPCNSLIVMHVKNNDKQTK